MIKTEHLEVWNLSQDGVARSGAVDIFNVVGRLKAPDTVRAFSYRLNGKAWTPIFYATVGSTTDRLRHPGDFSVDTIALADLEPHNLLRLRILREGGGEHEQEIRFGLQPFDQHEPRFRLDLAGAGMAEEVGQVVEGPWHVALDPRGRRCLEVRPEDAGYDRIILFGRDDWTTGYEVRTRLSVTRITGHHNIGVIFKWNPHERGDGTRLPQTWSTGLGYYCSYGRHPGIRIRFGVQVRNGPSGQRHGEYLLATRPLTSRWRVLLNTLKRKTRLSRAATELRLGRDYCFRMQVHPDRYALTVWEAHSPEPPPQLLVDGPVDRLPTGSVGILAYQVGVRIYEFEVLPMPLVSNVPASGGAHDATSSCGSGSTPTFPDPLRTKDRANPALVRANLDS